MDTSRGCSLFLQKKWRILSDRAGPLVLISTDSLHLLRCLKCLHCTVCRPETQTNQSSCVSFILVLLWMKEVVELQRWVDRYKVSILCMMLESWKTLLLSAVCFAFTAVFFVLLWWHPKDRPVRFWAKVARSPTCPQSEWRSPEEQVPEEGLSKGVSMRTSPKHLLRCL